MTAVPTRRDDPDALDPTALAPWLTIAVDNDGIEHVVLSDGWRRIRLDVEAGTLAATVPVVLRYRLWGIASAAVRILPLRRLIALRRHHRFVTSLFPIDKRIARWLELLRVADALAAGASHREIARVLYGTERVAGDWAGPSDSLRSRTRRLVYDATAMAQGGYRALLRGSMVQD